MREELGQTIRRRKLQGDPDMKYFDENGKNVSISNHHLSQSTNILIRELIDDTQSQRINQILKKDYDNKVNEQVKMNRDKAQRR